MIFYLKEDKRKKRKVYLKESSIMLLAESNNSKAARNKTKRLIAQLNNLDVNDPKVDETERKFENEFFGAENYSADWFIVLEPNAYSWAYGIDGDAQAAKGYLDYAKRRADIIFPEKQINAEYCRERGIEYDGTVNIKDVLTPEQFAELTNIKAPYREKRNAFITQIRQINTLYQVDSLLEPMIGQDNKAKRRDTRERIANGEEVKPNHNPNYDIVGPLTREESKEYGDKSGGGLSCKICYTQYPNTWLSPKYSDNNQNKLFILLSKDWESVKPEHDGSQTNNGLGAPYNELGGYDRYGMSMIFLWVTPEGELHESNTRWNHSGGFRVEDVDEAFTQGDIERLMGCSLPELTNIDALADKFDAIEERLENGEDFREVFAEFDSDDENGVVTYCDENMRYWVVKAYNRYNIYDSDSNKLLLQNRWADLLNLLNAAGDFVCKIGARLYVFIPDGNQMFVSPTEYMNVLQERINQHKYRYSELFDRYYLPVVGFCEINWFNMLNNDGTFMLDKWANNIVFYNTSLEGVLKVLIVTNQTRKYNLLKDDNSLLLEKWYDDIECDVRGDFGGFIIFDREKGYNIINKEFRIVSSEWFKRFWHVSNYEGFCIALRQDDSLVYLNINDGTILGEGMRIIKAGDFGDNFHGVGKVTTTDGNYLLTKDNELVSYDEYIEHLKEVCLSKLANGENAFKNSETIGNNVFVELADGYWNLLNEQKDGFVFPFYLYTEPSHIGNDITLISTRYNEDYMYNVIFKNGDILLNRPVNRWFTYAMEIAPNEYYGLELKKNGRSHETVLSVNKQSLLFGEDVEKWPDNVDNEVIGDGLLSIVKNKKYNFFNLNTEELLWKKPLKDWFDYIDCRLFSDSYNGGYFIVKKGNKHNLLTLNGKLKLKQWVDYISDDDDGFILKLNNKVNRLDIETGKLLFKASPENWPRNFGELDYDLGYRFWVGKKGNVLSPSGKLLWDKPYEEWFDGVGEAVSGGYIPVYKGRNKMNLLDKHGKLLFDKWYKNIDVRYNGYLYFVNVDGKINLMTKPSKFVWKQPVKKWFDRVKFDGTILNGKYGFVCEVYINNKKYYLSKKGKLYDKKVLFTRTSY